MPNLTELAIKYSSDKYHWHSYLPIYTALFEGGHFGMPVVGVKNLDYCFFCKYRSDSPVIPECINKGIQVKRLLEIGIGHESLMKPFLPADVPYVHGSGLKMWEEYFPEAKIFGCDIREDVLVNEGRIHSMVCDQLSSFDLGFMIGTFGQEWDVIIDDGCHDYEAQHFTASLLLHYAKPSLYVIEDVWADKGKLLAAAFGGEFWQGKKGRDDGLVIIRK